MGRARTSRPPARTRKGRQTQQEQEQAQAQAQAAIPSLQETQATSSQQETLQAQEESQAQPVQEDTRVEQTPNKKTDGYGLRMQGDRPGHCSSVPHNDGDRRSDDDGNDKNDVGNDDDSEEQQEESMLQTEYEKQRELRIRENQAKLAALCLPSLASSFHKPELAQNVSKTQRANRIKQSITEKVDEDDDDDYRPTDSSGESDMYASEEETYPNNTQEDACEEDEDLQQALTLSLEDHPSEKVVSEDGMRKSSRAKRRPVGSREKSRMRLKKGRREQFQPSNDEIVSIFSFIDEQGNGKFSVTELERVARLHDFTWTKQELFDMIDVFDCNKDGQLDFTEFQGIFARANEC